MAGLAINTIGFSLGFVSLVPLLQDAFPAAEQGKAIVSLGAGGCNFNDANCRSGGDYVPTISLYDTRGTHLGSNSIVPVFADNKLGEAATKKIDINTQVQAEYIQIRASSGDAVCISYVSVRSSAGDIRTWNAGIGQLCGAPWYPSPDVMPGTEDFRPGCNWLAYDGPIVEGRFPHSITAKLTDFTFPKNDETLAKGMRGQYEQNKDSLCRAPGRLMFWAKGGKHPAEDACLPFYPFVLEKNADGTDKDLNKVQYGHNFTCDTPGKPWFPRFDIFAKGPPPKPFGGEVGSVPIACAGKTPEECDVLAPPQPGAPAPGAGSFGGVVGSIPIPARAVKKRQEVGGGSFGGVVGSIPMACAGKTPEECDAITKGPGAVEDLGAGQDPSPDWQWEKRGGPIARRKALIAKRDHCVDRLVVSEHSSHSARDVCRSASSWGPDFVSVEEGLYCDMCTKELWRVCVDADDMECFDVEDQELRLDSSLQRRDGLEDVPAKEYRVVKRWSK